LIFAVLGGIWMSMSVLKRIDSVNKTAGEIMNGAFSRRIPVTERRDEFDTIAVKINQMLTRTAAMTNTGTPSSTLLPRQTA